MESKYFVLKPRSKNKGDQYAAASRMAMMAYAEYIEITDPEISIKLKAWAANEANRAMFGRFKGNEKT